jgi:hypothetical protein
MQKDNVTSFKSKVLTLESVKESLNNWRASKQRPNEGIPVSLWKQIFSLLGKHTETEIRSTLHLSPTQLERGSALLAKEEANQSNEAKPCSLKFCEVQNKTSYPLDYKPAQAFATNTCVVELYRPDGMLMKIHICTDKFEDLLHALIKCGKVYDFEISNH